MFFLGNSIKLDKILAYLWLVTSKLQEIVVSLLLQFLLSRNMLGMLVFYLRTDSSDSSIRFKTLLT